MNNLKRILSLALASVMVMGMMVTGASAAKFSDSEDIDHTAAVDVMAALGVIKGMDDGSFNPNGDVTRAQMAKMITVVMNGKEPNLGKPATATFTDSANHWALEYIEYCANLGIIAGRSTTTFDPEGKVTAAEAAKMILVTLGFDADVFGLVGANWSQNTITLASNLLVGDDIDTAEPLNLFSGLTGVTANTPLSRDQAAQLIYNGITANTVKMALTGVTSGSNTGILGGASGQTPTYSWSLTGDSLLESKFGASILPAVMVGAKYTKATSSSEAFWTYKVGDQTFDFAEDVSDLFRQRVQVIYKKLSGNRKTVLAIAPLNNGIVETCAVGDLYPNTAGTTMNGYDLAANGTDEDGNPTYHTFDSLPVYMFLNTTAGDFGGTGVLKDPVTAEGEALEYELKDYDTAQLIDHNGDGRLDCVVITEVKYTTVGAIRPTYIQLRNVTTNVALASNNVPEDLVVGDYVTYTTNPQTGVITVEKAEIITGTLAATMDESDYNDDSVRVNGSWYTVVNKYSDVKTWVGDDVKLVLIAGYVVDGEKTTTSTSSSDAVMAVAQAAKTYTNNTTVSGATEYLEVRVLKADGKTDDLKVTKVDGKPVKAATAEGQAEGDEVEKKGVENGVLYTYSADPDATGCVTLKTYAPVISGTPDPKDPEKTVANWDFDIKSDAAFNVKGGQITDDTNGTIRIAADGTFFVLAVAGNKYGVVKGSDLAKWNATDGYAATSSVVYINRSSNGFIYAQTGAIILDEAMEVPGATGEKTYYGFVTANASYTTLGNSRVISVTVWNGAENVQVQAKTVFHAAAEGDEGDGDFEAPVWADTKDYVIGTLVSYKDNGDGTANELNILDETIDAVSAWDGEGIIKFVKNKAGTELKIDNNTVILFMNAATGEGIANGNITTADWVDSFAHEKGYYANVLYMASNAEDVVTVLVLETNGRIGPAAKPIVVGAEETEEEHTHSYVWTEVTNENKGENESLTVGQHVKMCATDNAIDGSAHDAPTAWNEKQDGCTECDKFECQHDNGTTWSEAEASDVVDGEIAEGDHIKTCDDCDEVLDHHASSANTSGQGCDLTGCSQ